MKAIYLNKTSPGYLTSVNSLYRIAKAKQKSITRKAVDGFLATQDVFTLHKPARKHFTRRKYIPTGVDSDWQADLCDMQALKKENQGYGYILTCVDVMSGYKWALPIQTKEPKYVREAFARMITDRQPIRLMTDQGTEFKGAPFQQFLRQQDIHYFTSRDSGVKCGLVENFNRTLKNRIYKHFTHTRAHRWVEVLPIIVNQLNHMMNRTTKLRPIDFTKKNEKQLWLKHYGKHWNNQPKANLKVGQKVRISKYKHVFARGFLPQFTLEIFLIARVAAKLSKTMYYLQDLNKEPIEGGFYREEIVPVVKEDDVYHISKILKHRTYKGQKQLLVQWQGYGKEFDSWIPATNIVST